MPVLSEAEFLARRESVTRKMIIRQRDNLAQIAVLEDDILVEHYVDRDSSVSLIGNVYLGRVQNVLPSMEAAFIDIGKGRNAVLYAGEVDWDAAPLQGQDLAEHERLGQLREARHDIRDPKLLAGGRRHPAAPIVSGSPA